ncbi:fibronectin type III domain-containing protein [Aminipila terrae]|uniref:Fibronectin type-III domain-containing protein n=1 Tax=Aminipila terrae TaxID=2697030 RepID=A0A6P1MCU8_9FIRM|nr:fibronectin type III domain-containing protein [Aminipila terrae]QHI71661.1 hypothetical protein Ami3637_04030 [Aminipila terrae]
MKKRILQTVILILSLILLTVFGSSLDSFTYAAKPDRTAPSAPANLKAISVSDTSVTLSWSASTDNVGVTAYDIYRNNIYLASTSMTSYTANGLNPSSNYQFYVKAKDAKGNISNSSNIISLSTTSNATPPSQPLSKK